MSFCANCGKKLEEGAAFCPSCGTSTTPLAEKKERLSMEDYLAMNPEYLKAKDSFNKANNRNGLFTVLGIFLLYGGSIAIGFATFVLFLPLILSTLGTIAICVIAASKERRLKKELDNCASRLYKDYLEKNGFPV